MPDSGHAAERREIGPRERARVRDDDGADAALEDGAHRIATEYGEAAADQRADHVVGADVHVVGHGPGGPRNDGAASKRAERGAILRAPRAIVAFCTVADCLYGGVNVRLGRT